MPADTTAPLVTDSRTPGTDARTASGVLVPSLPVPLAVGAALRQILGEELTRLGGSDARIVVLDGDVGSSTGVAAFESVHPGRFVQAGIAEQNMVGMAAGLATVGFQPWVTGFACFVVARALDSIRVLVAQPNLDVKIIGGYAGLLTGKAGKTHQILDDLAIMRSMPNVCVVAPADQQETRSALNAVAQHPGPCYVQLTRDPSPILFGGEHAFRLGEAVLLREGTDVTVVSTGVQTTRVVEAAELLNRRGVQARVLHAPTVAPLDSAAVVAAAAATGLVVTVEEQDVNGGLGGAVAECLGERYPVPVVRLGVSGRYGESGSNDDLLAKFRLTPEAVASDVESIVRTRHSRTASAGGVVGS